MHLHSNPLPHPPPPTTTPSNLQCLLVGSTFGIRSEVCDGAFLAETVKALSPLAILAEELHG